jgi:hypothetical protein
MALFYSAVGGSDSSDMDARNRGVGASGAPKSIVALPLLLSLLLLLLLLPFSSVGRRFESTVRFCCIEERKDWSDGATTKVSSNKKKKRSSSGNRASWLSPSFAAAVTIE